jgi:hypothetical protein
MLVRLDGHKIQDTLDDIMQVLICIRETNQDPRHKRGTARHSTSFLLACLANEIAFKISGEDLQLGRLVIGPANSRYFEAVPKPSAPALKGGLEPINPPDLRDRRDAIPVEGIDPPANASIAPPGTKDTAIAEAKAKLENHKIKNGGPR